MTLMDESARADELGGDLPVESEASIASSTRGSSPRGPLVPALVAALVVTFASTIVFATLYLTDETTGDAVGEVLAAELPQVEERAGRVANLFANYDAANIGEVSSQMLELATGSFLQQYEDLLTQGGGLGTALEESSASSRGRIIDGPHVYFRDAAEAIALVEVTQTIQTNSNPAGVTYDYLLQITLIDKVDEGWKADAVEVLRTRPG
jgi:hypothetical protein